MINCLASYPKSGNTWIRIALDAYLRDKEPDINDLLGTYSDSSVILYRVAKDVDFLELPFEHQVLMRPAALLRLHELASKIEYETDLDYWPVIVKTHIANAMSQSIRFFPPSIIGKTIYIVRDPRSVVISFAKHFGKTIDEAIDAVLTAEYSLFNAEDPLKVSQYVSNWMQHVWTFATATDFDVSIIRYEDLRNNPLSNFRWILQWFEIEYDEARAKRAIHNSELSKLRQQEDEKGFKEVSEKSDRFFGKGLIDGWRTVLTKEQTERIEKACYKMMVEFKYLKAEEKAA